MSLYKSPTYHSWDNMKGRCLNPNNRKYPSYGARGITVCPEWMSFEKFLADMGEKPKGTSLDRKDNDGNYEPNNCRWATPLEQQRNTSANIKAFDSEGVEWSTWELVSATGRNYETIRYRVNAGWTVERILNS